MNKVRPIKDPDKLREIREGLAARTDWHGERMFLLFEIGINTGLPQLIIRKLSVSMACRMKQTCLSIGNMGND